MSIRGDLPTVLPSKYAASRSPFFGSLPWFPRFLLSLHQPLVSHRRLIASLASCGGAAQPGQFPQALSVGPTNSFKINDRRGRASAFSNRIERQFTDGQAPCALP